MTTLVVGHRGASREAPENTAAAFRLAFEEGADGIEADFRLTRDGAVVCLHDANTRRTAGVEVVVADAELPRLRALDVGVWKGARYRGETIPTLQEVLRLLPDGKLLFVELKSGPEILPPLFAVLESSGTDPGRIRLLSFDSAVIRAAKDRSPAYRACWLTDYRFRGGWRPAPDEVLDTALSCGADGVATRARGVVDASFVALLRRHGMEIHLWTVDNEREGRRLQALGVDSIMTNRPAFLRRALLSP